MKKNILATCCFAFLTLLYTDFSYIMAMKQHYNYSGEPIINAGSSGKSGSHLTLNIGLSFSIGDYDDHADFY